MELTKGEQSIRDSVDQVITKVSELNERYLEGKAWTNGAELKELLAELDAYITYLAEINSKITYRYYMMQQQVLKEEWTTYEIEFAKYKEDKKENPRPTAEATNNRVAVRMGRVKAFKKETDILMDTYVYKATRWQSILKDIHQEMQGR